MRKKWPSTMLSIIPVQNRHFISKPPLFCFYQYDPTCLHCLLSLISSNALDEMTENSKVDAIKYSSGRTSSGRANCSSSGCQTGGGGGACSSSSRESGHRSNCGGGGEAGGLRDCTKCLRLLDHCENDNCSNLLIFAPPLCHKMTSAVFKIYCTFLE